MKDDLISLEFFVTLLAIHNIPPEVTAVFVRDYKNAFPSDIMRTEHEWLTVTEVWAELIKKQMADIILEKFNSDKVQ